MKELKKLKIKKIKSLGTTKVHDISVADTHHYIDKNGIVHHNSGREYGASAILMVTKARLRDSKKEQIGIILTAKPNKNRFVIPNQVKVHLDYKKGLNPYVGLEQYLKFGWNKYGIEKGEVFDEKEYKSKSKAIRDKCEEFDFEGEKRYFYKKTATTIAVRHLGKHLTPNEFFGPEFFSTEMLEKIDEMAYPLFNYGVDDEIPSDEFFEEIVELDEDEE